MDTRTLAAVNLFAVLRNLEDLVELDDQAKAIVGNTSLKLRFSVPTLDPQLFSFSPGKCVVTREREGSQLSLRFFSPQHLNEMVAGTKLPFPTKGYSRLRFLQRDFAQLGDRLTNFLRPTPEQLKNPEFRKISTILTAYTAFFALSEIGNFDPIGQLSAKRMGDGVVQVEIQDGTGAYIEAKAGHLTTHKGHHPSPTAWMSFDSMDTAEGILRGTLDSYACIGKGKLAVRGKIPMIDHLNKLLSLVAVYLA